MITCPVSNSTNVLLVDRISIEKISAYYKPLGVEVKDTFKGTEYVLKYRSVESGYQFYHPFTIQGGAALYEKLEKLNWYYQEQKWEHIRSLNLISPTDRILEIGCGNGSFLSLVKKKCGGEPVGLELNPNAVEKAVLAGLKVYNQDVENFSKENQEKFDNISLFQVLEHIANPVEFLNQALEMLKPDGRLIVCVPDNDSLVNKDMENPLNLPPHHMGLWNRQSLTFLAQRLNLKLELIENEPLQEYHVDWYVRTLLKRFFGKALFYRVIAKTNIPAYLSKVVRARALKIKGHSILAAYRK